MAAECSPRRRLLPWLAGCTLLCLAAAEALAFSSWVALRDQGVVRQRYDFSCGLAALATLLGQQFGIATSETALLQRMGLGPERLASPDTLDTAAIERINRGVSMAGLAALADEFGLRALGVAVNMEQLRQLRVPAIAHVRAQGEPHFTVIRGIGRGGQVQVADPSWGNRLFSAADFAQMFLDGGTGRGRLLLLSSPSPSPSRSAPDAGATGALPAFGVTRARPVVQHPQSRFPHGKLPGVGQQAVGS